MERHPSLPAAKLAAAHLVERPLYMALYHSWLHVAGSRRRLGCTLYVSNTSEDPKLGAHDAFLGEMMDKAEDFRFFDVHEDSNALKGWHSKH